MEIKIDDLTGGEVISLLEEHLADMYATSPAQSVHALDINALKDSSITFYGCWNNATLLGCVWHYESLMPPTQSLNQCAPLQMHANLALPLH